MSRRIITVIAALILSASLFGNIAFAEELPDEGLPAADEISAEEQETPESIKLQTQPQYAEGEDLEMPEEFQDEMEAIESENNEAQQEEKFITNAVGKTNYDRLPELKKIKDVSLMFPFLEYTGRQIFVYGNLDIVLNDGSTLPKDQYEATPDSNFSIGKHLLKVEFKDRYSGCPNRILTYTIIPGTASEVSFPADSSIDPLHAVRFDIRLYQGIKADNIYILYSKNSNMSGAKSKMFKYGDKYTITGLAKNTTYYVQIYCRKKGSDGVMYYSHKCHPFSIKTASYVYPTPTLANTKSVYAKLKKGKTFTLNARATQKSTTRYIHGLFKLYPYYFKTLALEAYKVSYVREMNGIATRITFKTASGITKTKKTQTKINSIVAGAKKKKSNAERVKYVNKRIKATTTYKRTKPYCYTAYGCLVQKKAVCAGYAETFNWCMNELGIRNTCKYNTPKDHIWNLVYIKYKGKTRWWNVDVTWNDAGKTNKYLLTKSHSMR